MRPFPTVTSDINGASPHAAIWAAFSVQERPAVISACMLDGFGWFHEADYRRSWLFFDEVSYVLPAELAGPLAYPVDLEARPEFQTDRLTLGDEVAGQLAEASRLDAESPTFVELCRTVPPKDAEYAQTVVWSDPEARRQFGEAVLARPTLALAYLLNKLDHCARSRGLVPIVGQPYASDMLAWRASRQVPALPWKKQPPRDVYAAFAAGLSLDFLGDSDLADVDIQRLALFKEQNLTLMEQSQESILATSERFAKLANAPEFPAELAALRADARARRKELDHQANEAWREAGLEIAKKAIAAGGTALAGGVLLSSLTTAGVATMIAAGAVVASEILDPIARPRKVHAGMAYLYKLGTLTREAALGLPTGG